MIPDIGELRSRDAEGKLLPLGFDLRSLQSASPDDPSAAYVINRLVRANITISTPGDRGETILLARIVGERGGMRIKRLTHESISRLLSVKSATLMADGARLYDVELGAFSGHWLIVETLERLLLEHPNTPRRRAHSGQHEPTIEEMPGNITRMIERLSALGVGDEWGDIGHAPYASACRALSGMDPAPRNQNGTNPLETGIYDADVDPWPRFDELDHHRIAKWIENSVIHQWLPGGVWESAQIDTLGRWVIFGSSHVKQIKR